jgi:hypothetical protein
MRLIEPREDFDKCIIGIVSGGGRAVYDTELVIETFMRTEGWDYDSALDFFYTNTLSSAQYDEDGPIFMSKEFELED